MILFPLLGNIGYKFTKEWSLGLGVDQGDALITISKECSLKQLGVVPDSTYTNKVEEAEITSPVFREVPLPLEAVK